MMNQTHVTGNRKIQSAFNFIKDQVDSYNKIEKNSKKRRKTIQRHWSTAVSIAAIIMLSAAPFEIGGVQETTVNTKPEVFTSAARLDKQSYSLLVIEEKKVEIKPGKSLAQAEADAKRARTSRLATVPRPATSLSKVSTDEAHRMAKEAAAKAGIPDQWKELAAIWQVETGKLASGCVVSLEDGRATGPMQFMPGTFRAYQADGDGDGHADICNAKDALVAAGKLLKRGGIDQGNVDGAIHNYNHSMAYVRKVKAIASTIQ